MPASKLEGVINKDLKKIGIRWDEVQEAVEDRLLESCRTMRRR